MRRILKTTSFVTAILAAAMLAGCLDGTDTSASGEVTPQAGGTLTRFDASSAAFSLPAPNLSQEELVRHHLGDASFEAKFVTAPSPVNAGLGPLFNNISCIACHAGDGRGRPPAPGEALTSMLFRINAAGQDEHGGPKPMPGYGGQLQTHAVFGDTAEGDIAISYRDSTVQLSDTAIVLRVPTYTFKNPWKPLSETPLLSPRVAPPVFGLGLLEAVAEADILAKSDPDDRDRDGISGKPNYVYDTRKGVKVLGRFGWKANNPNLDQQNAGAFNQDMGITTPLFPAESCAGDRPDCTAHAAEVDSATLEAVTFYIQSLAVPGRRNWQDAQVQQGEKLFASIGCAVCHSPEMHTGSVAGEAVISNQTFHPYTDLLLHDMGSGLSDGRPDYDASGSEWRTSPLWGVGLTQTISGHTFLLHDGRARNLLEAVLWHGGEATKSRNAVLQLSKSDRLALLAFLQSL